MRASRCFISILFITSLILSPAPAFGSAPILSTKSDDSSTTSIRSPPSTATCDSSHEEDRILCQAASRKRDSIRQVMAEDPTAQAPDSPDEPTPPPADRAAQAWTAAFNQWVGQKSSNEKHGSANSAERAIEAARQRMSKAAGEVPTTFSTSEKPIEETEEKTRVQSLHTSTGTQSSSSSGTPVISMAHPPENATSDDFDIPSLDPGPDDDELTLITRAAHVLSLGAKVSSTARNRALELVDDLCAGGDNGRQFASSDGLPPLISLLALPRIGVKGQANSDVATAVSAARALASCTQNNAPVFNAAVAAGAIPALVSAAAHANAHPALRAAVLRALVAVAVADAADDELWSEREAFVPVVVDAIVASSNKGEEVTINSDTRRSLLRGLATVELCLLKSRRWRTLFSRAGVLEGGKAAMGSSDVDIREGAARVVKLLR